MGKRANAAGNGYGRQGALYTEVTYIKQSSNSTLVFIVFLSKKIAVFLNLTDHKQLKLELICRRLLSINTDY